MNHKAIQITENIYRLVLTNEQETESSNLCHTGKCIRRFGGIYAYCRFLIDQKC